MQADIKSLPLLEVRGIRKTFVSRRLFKAKREVIAAEGVSFQLDAGETLIARWRLYRDGSAGSAD